MKFCNAFVQYGDVVLLYRDSRGVLRKKQFPGEYSSFLRKSEITDACERILEKQRKREDVTDVRDEGDYLRVIWKHPHRRDEECGKKGWYEEAGVPTYEADVSPLRRYISDNGIEIARPKRVYLDIETDSRVPFDKAILGEAQVVCVVLVDETGEVIPLMCGHNVVGDSESLLLDATWTALQDYDQVVAWNGAHFDFEVLRNRSRKLGVKVDTRRWLWLDHLKAFKRYNVGSADSGDEKTSYALDNVARNLKLAGKHDLDASKTWEAWAAGGESRQKLLDYCIQDTRLLAQIEEKTGYLELFQTLCEVTNIFPETRSLQPTHQVDGLLLRLGQQRGVHFATKYYSDSEEPHEKFAGAYVMPPSLVGIGENVFVGDFASLYPSIMITWNISPETKGHGPTVCTAPTTGVTFRTDKVGILPLALSSLLDLRTEWKKKFKAARPGSKEAKDAERRSTAYKIAANAFYGVMGSPYSRYFDRDIAESTTQTGVWLIQKAKEYAHEEGMEVVYVDTDSVFVRATTDANFKLFLQRCNNQFYPDLCERQGCATFRISLGFDKTFARIVFVSAKRYVGVYAGQRVAEVKGLETKRGDTAKLARKLQQTCIDLFVDGCTNVETYRSVVEVMQGYVLETLSDVSLVQITKSLAKPIDEYKTRVTKDGEDSAGAPHVRVAKILRERGEDVSAGTKISYVVVNGDGKSLEVIPASDFTGEFDRFFLWENLVYPPTMRLLQAMFPDEDWERAAHVRPKKERKKRTVAEMQRIMFAPVAQVVTP